MRDEAAARLERYLRVAYDGAPGARSADARSADAQTPDSLSAEVASEVGSPQVPAHARRRTRSRWAVRSGAAIRVAALLLVLTVAGLTLLVLSRSAAAPAAPSAEPSPPAAAVTTAATSGAEPSQPVAVVVHVAGEVNEPGLVQLPAGTRVADAIEAAGGATGSADLDALNLAAPLIDGQQVYVPAEGEVPPPVAGQGQAGAGGAALVDVNTADATTLETLPGIGPALAARIIDWRSEHGPFASVEALVDVPGIGTATLERLRDLVTV